jgi:RNA polymerase sigma factor (sigma-70 family)
MKNIQKLVVDFMPLANKLACQKKKNLPKFVDLEDLKSAAYLGLVEAANRFNPDLGIKFSTFAYLRILGSICDYLREYYKINKNINIFSLNTATDEQDFSFADIIPAKTEHKIEETLEFFTLGLDQQAKKIIQYYFIDGYTMKETGDKLGLSESRVSQLIKFYKFLIKNNFTKTDLVEKLAA